jgi:hypothetical protein
MTGRAQSSPVADLKRRLDAYSARVRANSLQRWKKNLLSGSAYAAAAGSALAFTTAADAGIIYSGPLNVGITNITFVGNSVVLKTLATRPIPGLNAIMSLRFNSGRTSSGKFRRAGAASLVGNGRFQFLDTGFDLSRLVKSNNVPGGSGVFRNFGRVHRRVSFPFSTNKMTRTRGYFPKGVTGFAGFRFANSSVSGIPLYHYGWIRVKWDDSVVLRYKGFPQFLTVIDWAYNTMVGQPIHVGDTQSVPEPSTLVLAVLAAGVTGVQAWRRFGVSCAGKDGV